MFADNIILKADFDFPQNLPEGHFVGIANMAKIIDKHGEMIGSGAFTKTLKEHGDQRPLYWWHFKNSLIGRAYDIQNTSAGLITKGEIYLNGEQNKNILQAMRDGTVTEMSVGGRVIKSETRVQNGKSYRYLSEVSLSEISLMPMLEAANPDSLITAVKSEVGCSGETNVEFLKYLCKSNDKEFIGYVYQVCLKKMPTDINRKPVAKSTFVEQPGNAFFKELAKIMEV
jgi:HK97 family phage prohead protease